MGLCPACRLGERIWVNLGDLWAPLSDEWKIRNPKSEIEPVYNQPTAFKEGPCPR